MTAIEESQNEFMRWAEMEESLKSPNCIHGFGNADCAYPACKCLAMPIKADSWPNIEFAGQEEHAEHLEATREYRSPSHFRPMVKYCLASALLVTLGAIFIFS